MEFVADESVQGQIVHALRSAGHIVHSINEVAKGSPDRAVLAIAHERTIILLTEDKDFGDLVFAKSAPHSGIVLIRLDGRRAHEKAARAVMAISAHENELVGAFTVIDENKVRVRRQT